jgi:oxygen-dependent protoporphyrinogen oxidase
VALRLLSQIYFDAEGEDADGPLRATHVISALPLPVLDSILQPPPAGEAAAGGASTTHTSLPHLRANPHSSVTVLNLVFSTTTTSIPNGSTGEAATTTPTPTPTPLHPPGFGYLIPRPEHGYPEPGQEDEEEPGPGLLGVVFDTASLPEQDNDAANDAAPAGFTKLTAMLGGPYPSSLSGSESESDAQLVAAVLPRISSQLGHALPPPVHYAVHRNVESIPTYLVGHTARMEELRRALSERWGGRLKVVGAGVGGVSVADCVKAGRQAAFEVGAQINSRT